MSSISAPNSGQLFQVIPTPLPLDPVPAASTYQVTADTRALSQEETSATKILLQATLVTQASLAVLANVPIFRWAVTLVQKIISILTSLVSGTYAASQKKINWISVAFSTAAIALAALGLASVIVGSPALLIGATVAEATLQFASAIRCLAQEKKDIKQALIHLCYAVAASLAAAGLLSGSFIVSITAAAFGLAITLALVCKCLKEKKWLEASCYAVMAGAQSWGLSTQVKQYIDYKRQKAQQADLQRRWKELLAELKDKKTETGYQDKWDFRSDHLPIGYEQNGKIFISWNVCNSNSRGYFPGMKLDQSLMAKEDIPVPGALDGLTVRDVNVAQTIVRDMLVSSDVMALQECSPAFLTELAKHLPDNFKLILPTGGYQGDANVIVYNTNTMHLKESATAFPYTTSAPNRSVTTAVFDEGVVICAHVPGDPARPGLSELTQYVDRFGNDRPVLSIGDNNFGPWEASASGPFFAVPSYPSQGGSKVHPTDTAWLDWCYTNREVRPLKPDEVLPGLSKIVELLSPDKNARIGFGSSPIQHH